MSLLNGKRVLIVEDECFIADILGEAVEAAGGLVIGPFATIGEAQQALVEDVHLAVLDVNVRDGVTYPLATQLDELGIPFVFATGQTKKTEPAEWRSYPWFAKPYQPEDVIGWLASTFEAPNHAKQTAYPT